MTEDKDVDRAAAAALGAAGSDSGGGPVGEADAGSPSAGDSAVNASGYAGVVNESDSSEADAEAAMLSMLDGLPQEERSASADDINFGSASVSNAEFQQLSQPGSGTQSRNIDLLMDVNLPVSIELGRTRLSIADILALGPGSVVELNKLAGEPVDLLVNQKVVAKGEVVVVDENFGLRVTQLVTREERLKSLGND